MFSLHFFPDHLSRWPRWVMLFKHSKSIPCRCAGAGLSLKCSSYNCEALVSWLPSSFPLFSVFFVFFSFFFSAIYLFVSIQLKRLCLCWVAMLFSLMLYLVTPTMFEKKQTYCSLEKRKTCLPHSHPPLHLLPQALPLGRWESSINWAWGTQPPSAWHRGFLLKSCWW